jgi:hypothetical protein
MINDLPDLTVLQQTNAQTLQARYTSWKQTRTNERTSNRRWMVLVIQDDLKNKILHF